MMEQLKWDTNFFKFKVCKIITKNYNLKLTKIKNNLCKLIYVFSEKEMNNYTPIDVKLTFKKNVISNTVDNSIIPFESLQHSFDELLNLVLLSGKYSRFKLDSNFPKGSFNRLYRKWILKALSLPFPLGVYVKIIDKQIAGFITIESESNFALKIGLIAVNPKFQGQGLASQLINKAYEVTIKAEKKTLKVATQQNNQAAVNLYNKNGFKLDSNIYIYHIWM